MSVRKLRKDNGWSQEQLAQISGLSVRTIQRIEQGGKAGLDSLKALAAAFDVNIRDLINEDEMNEVEARNGSKKLKDRREEEAIEYVKNLKGFHISWMTYLIIIPGLYLLNIFVTPGYLWVIWPALGWGAAIILHGFTLFGLFGVFGADWEQRQFEKRMKRD
ncbi:2TM domain-containing protein [Pseudemcibacter aquimaris]|uniref:2TM domain-containing protein n=1 Tax=Pseudemcibacter aquimaris TaxID=2857064 RepID=UPI0020110D3B|nr:2TM domain-containing protein [Pseudemcibacter aquimaris]MCC3862487.1 2TM domain-containing protein [Pseudemcibacter aquimaris]WDU59085.1 2TM domain-containing protein [Pseudemcibacter aquimaris]